MKYKGMEILRRRIGTSVVIAMVILLGIGTMVYGANQLHWGFGDGEDLPAGQDRGVSYFVDDAYGNDANNGLTWATAKKTIQAAVNVATSNNGDYIYVKKGNYYESVTVNKANLHIIGEDQNLVQVISFSVTFDYVEICGFSIGPPDPNSSMASVTSTRNHLDLHDNTIKISESNNGVYLWSSISRYSKIYSNLFMGDPTERGTGIKVYNNGVFHEIYDNEFWGAYIGIELDTSDGNCYIYNNRFNGLNSGISGAYGIKITNGDDNHIAQNWIGYCTTPMDDSGDNNVWLDNHWDGWTGPHNIMAAHTNWEQVILQNIDVPSEGKVTVRLTFNPYDLGIPIGATITLRIYDPTYSVLLAPPSQWTQGLTDQVFPTVEVTVDGGKNQMTLGITISNTVTATVAVTYEIMDA
jgi:hypothetical protein